MIITVEEIEEGMILSDPVLSRNGQVLLNEGANLTERHKSIFKNRGITMVNVRNEEEEEIVVNDEIRNEAKYIFMARMVTPPVHSFEKEVTQAAIEHLANQIAKQQATQ